MATEVQKQAVLFSRNPANKELIGKTICTAVNEIPAIVQRAREASLSWRKKSISERLECVKRFRDLLSHGRDALSKLITTECGKPFTKAMVSEVFAILETCQWLENRAPQLLKDKHVDLNPIFLQAKNHSMHLNRWA